MPLLWDDELPKRKSKPKPNVLEHIPEFVQLRALALNNKIGLYREVGMLLTTEDAKRLGIKAPWRVAADRLRAAIRAAGLEDEYHVRKDQTNTPGVWRVTVAHEPPLVAPKKEAEVVNATPAPPRPRGRPRKS